MLLLYQICFNTATLDCIKSMFVLFLAEQVSCDKKIIFPKTKDSNDVVRKYRVSLLMDYYYIYLATKVNINSQ